jgi:hypothetical protein
MGILYSVTSVFFFFLKKKKKTFDHLWQLSFLSFIGLIGQT